MTIFSSQNYLVHVEQHLTKFLGFKVKTCYKTARFHRLNHFVQVLFKLWLQHQTLTLSMCQQTIYATMSKTYKKKVTGIANMLFF